jgi:nucleoid-associated protein YgaU
MKNFTKFISAIVSLGLIVVLAVGCATSQKRMEPVAKKQAESEFMKGLEIVEKPELEPDWADYVKDRYPNWKRHYWYDRGQWGNRGYVVGRPPASAEPVVETQPQLSPLPPVQPPVPVIEETQPPVVPEPAKPTKYVVQKGDSLWKISGKVYGNPLKWPKIYRANKDKIKNPHRIYPNQVLVIPWD